MRFTTEGFNRYSDSGTFRIQLTPVEISKLMIGKRVKIHLGNGSVVIVSKNKKAVTFIDEE